MKAEVLGARVIPLPHPHAVFASERQAYPCEARTSPVSSCKAVLVELRVRVRGRGAGPGPGALAIEVGRHHPSLARAGLVDAQAATRAGRETGMAAACGSGVRAFSMGAKAARYVQAR